MKKWWMKGLAVALCAGMLASAAAVSVPGGDDGVCGGTDDSNARNE